MHPGKVVCNVFLVVFTCCSLTLSEAASDLINPKTSSKQFAISQNEVSYKDPQWLQDVPWASGAAKYRKRRFLSFPTGSALAVSLLFIQKCSLFKLFDFFIYCGSMSSSFPIIRLQDWRLYEFVLRLSRTHKCI